MNLNISNIHVLICKFWCRNDSLWVTSSNTSSCLNDTAIEEQCPKSSQFECICSTDDCGVLYDGLEPTCLGTDKWTKNRGFLSIQPVREWVTEWVTEWLLNGYWMVSYWMVREWVTEWVTEWLLNGKLLNGKGMSYWILILNTFIIISGQKSKTHRTFFFKKFKIQRSTWS